MSQRRLPTRPTSVTPDTPSDNRIKLERSVDDTTSAGRREPRSNRAAGRSNVQFRARLHRPGQLQRSDDTAAKAPIQLGYYFRRQKCFLKDLCFNRDSAPGTWENRVCVTVGT